MCICASTSIFFDCSTQIVSSFSSTFQHRSAWLTGTFPAARPGGRGSRRTYTHTPHTHTRTPQLAHTHRHAQQKQDITISNRNRSSRDAKSNHRHKPTNWLWQDVERTTESVEAAATRLWEHSSDQTAKTSLNTRYKKTTIPIKDRIPTASVPSASKHADKHKTRRLH